MRKIILALIVLISVANLSANSTVGVYTSVDHKSVTYSMDKLEFELDLWALRSSSLYISADYTLVSKKFNISSANGFFWDLGLGAGMGISDGYFGVSILAPFELGYKFPVVAAGIDLYAQAVPQVLVFPSIDIGFDIGLGVRIGF
ncbi:MAG: hypothetical protein JXR64_12630 [Spirochaetales bacterium]|nr:hypothetical protein [Spirochaetales bacterium]